MTIPELGPALPRRGGPVSRGLGRAMLKLLGWRIEGAFPEVGRFIIIGAPHTSNWDFPVAMSAMLALGLDARWMGKHSLFRPPLGPVMRWFGGLPVRRDAAGGVVEQMVEQFERQERLVLGIAPEGTRKRVVQWKTGFYRIAVAAGVPIVPVSFDYARKVVGIGPALYPSGDQEADLRTLRGFYRDVTARNPELFVHDPDG